MNTAVFRYAPFLLLTACPKDGSGGGGDLTCPADCVGAQCPEDCPSAFDKVLASHSLTAVYPFQAVFDAGAVVTMTGTDPAYDSDVRNCYGAPYLSNEEVGYLSGQGTSLLSMDSGFTLSASVTGSTERLGIFKGSLASKLTDVKQVRVSFTDVSQATVDMARLKQAAETRKKSYCPADARVVNTAVLAKGIDVRLLDATGASAKIDLTAAELGQLTVGGSVAKWDSGTLHITHDKPVVVAIGTRELPAPPLACEALPGAQKKSVYVVWNEIDRCCGNDCTRMGRSFETGEEKPSQANATFTLTSTCVQEVMAGPPRRVGPLQHSCDATTHETSVVRMKDGSTSPELDVPKAVLDAWLAP